MLMIKIDDSSDFLPIYIQLKQQITDQIRTGHLPAGTRLPSSRLLAQQLQISRGSVVKAYEELCADGVCISRVGLGTIVSEKYRESENQRSSQVMSAFDVPNEPLVHQKYGISLLPSIANTQFLPKSELRKAFDRTLRYPSRLTAFDESAGDYRLRKLICEKLLPERGIEAHPKNVLVIPGTQYSSVLMALTLIKQRHRLHFGEPGYLDIARNFARFGFSLHGHQMDNNGIQFDAPFNHKDVLYLMPEHHFPQCITLSEERRSFVLNQAKDNHLLIIEDDYDSEIYYDRMPLPALKSADDGDNIIYTGTFSKTLFNSLRLGYIVANDDLIQEMASLHWSLSRGTSGVLQHWVAELLDNDTLKKHITKMRSVYLRKRDKVAQLLIQHFPDWSFDIPKGGLQFYLKVGSPELASKIVSGCRAMNIDLAHPSNYVFHDKHLMDFIIIGFGALDIEDIERAMIAIKCQIK